MKKIVYLVIAGGFLAILWALNNPDPAIVEKSIESAIGVDLPSEFEIVNYKEGGLNDYSVLYKIRISESEFEELLSKIDKEDWERKSDSLIIKTVTISYSEFIVLAIDSSDQTVHYNHLRD